MKPFRTNVAVLLRWNQYYLALRRQDSSYWQCVQGGVQVNDTSLEQALLREVAEEIGLLEPDILFAYRSICWRRYYFLQRAEKIYQDPEKSAYQGQDQLWFLADINRLKQPVLQLDEREFSDYRFVSLQQLLQDYPPFKKDPLIHFCHELRAQMENFL